MINLSYKIYSLALCGALLFNTPVWAQKDTATVLPRNWHQLDLKADGYYGISLKQAYNFLKGKKSKTVIVATIDSGADTLQRDLASILWVNPKEIPGNGKDDDHDGFVDDVHGWDFLGGPNGKCDFNETTEEIREYYKLKNKYGAITDVPAADKKEYNYWLTVKAIRDSTITKSDAEYKQLNPVMNVLMVTGSILKNAMKLSPDASFTTKDIDNLQTTNDTVKESKTVWTGILQQEGAGATSTKVIKDLSEYLKKLNSDINPDLDARKNIVGDNPDDNTNPHYGNNLIKFEDASHGTGVAGLIGAVRNNGYGVDGVADNVRIMPIKAVPDGDEYDKDIANAIRFAVNHGARVVNMSFGKKISPHKKWVDDAFKYATTKNVLLVMAAGNDSQNVDTKPSYPNDTYEDGSGTDAPNVINVGASAAKLDDKLAGSFSNYGKNEVDVFAPGVDIYSTIPGSNYGRASGTSMACPVVAGTAALLLEYFPKLSAEQLKYILIKSAVAPDMDVNVPGTNRKVKMSELCVSGGIINAYEAVKLAATIKGDRK